MARIVRSDVIFIVTLSVWLGFLFLEAALTLRKEQPSDKNSPYTQPKITYYNNGLYPWARKRGILSRILPVS